MSVKGLGAVLIIAGCGGFGFSMAAGARQQVKLLQQLIHCLEVLEAELQYRLTGLPDLCELAAKSCNGILREFFVDLKQALLQQNQPDVAACADSVLSQSQIPSGRVRKHLRRLGHSLGRFDLSGQLQGLKSIQSACQSDLLVLKQNQDLRLRSYQTLSLCAGTALVILFA